MNDAGMNDMRVLRTPLSERQLNIQAFSRLITLSRGKGYRGKRIDDKTPEDLAKAIALWLHFEGYKAHVNGTTVTIPFSDGNFVIQVENTHRTAPNYPPADYTGEYEITVHNLYGFEKWFNENLKTQDDD